MARTPLLRVLKRLAREHDAAEHLGITPADLRQRRNTDFSRREFIKSAAAIGVLASIKGIKPALALSKPRIAIVGAGISGLAAALKLQDNGIDAIVYESRSPCRRAHAQRPQRLLGRRSGKRVLW